MVKRKTQSKVVSGEKKAKQAPEENLALASEEEDIEDDESVQNPLQGAVEVSTHEDDDDSPTPPSFDGEYVNKQRVLCFCSRGVTARARHLLEDLRKLLPHHKKEVKLDAKDDLRSVNEVAEIKSCNSALFFESRKRQDLYLWASKTPHGPSAKFLVRRISVDDVMVALHMLSNLNARRQSVGNHGGLGLSTFFVTQ